MCASPPKIESSEASGLEGASSKLLLGAESLLSSLPFIIVVLDSKLVVEQWNRQAEVTFQVAADDALGRALLEVLPDWDWDQLQQHFEVCDRDGQSSLQPICLRPPGQALRIVGTSVVRLDRGAQVGYLVSGSDITRAFAQLSAVTKLESIGRLAAGIAHELNTPIQYIGHNLTFLQEAFNDLKQLFNACHERSSEVRGTDALGAVMEAVDLAYLEGEIPMAIEQGREGVERVAHIVAAMKEFSHPGSPEKSFVDLNRLLESTCTVCRIEWKYVADLVMDLDSTMPHVECLGAELSQACLNLIINAAHAIGDALDSAEGGKGTITISTRSCGDFAEIRIADTGTGIPKACASRIFEPFFTTKAVGRGTGQGLALARSVVVEKHRGSLTFETEEGAGTVFIIRLPILGQPMADVLRP